MLIHGAVADSTSRIQRNLVIATAETHRTLGAVSSKEQVGNTQHNNRTNTTSASSSPTKHHNGNSSSDRLHHWFPTLSPSVNQGARRARRELPLGPHRSGSASSVTTYTTQKNAPAEYTTHPAEYNTQWCLFFVSSAGANYHPGYIR